GCFDNAPRASALAALLSLLAIFRSPHCREASPPSFPVAPAHLFSPFVRREHGLAAPLSGFSGALGLAMRRAGGAAPLPAAPTGSGPTRSANCLATRASRFALRASDFASALRRAIASACALVSRAPTGVSLW